MRLESGSGVKIDADPKRLHEVRRAVSAFGTDNGLSEEDAAGLVFAVNEAVANAIEHGKPFADGTVEMWLAADAETVTVEVADCGRFGPPSYGRDENRGRGLAMSREMVDNVGVRRDRGRTVVTLTKRLVAD